MRVELASKPTVRMVASEGTRVTKRVPALRSLPRKPRRLSTHAAMGEPTAGQGPRGDETACDDKRRGGVKSVGGRSHASRLKIALKWLDMQAPGRKVKPGELLPF